MITPGHYHDVTVIEEHENGGFLLEDATGDTVWMPERLASDSLSEGEKLTVFVYKDKEERLTATLTKPKLTLGEIALLQVVDTNNYGAFLDWGMDKDLFVPHKEQSEEMLPGEEYLVYLYLDKKTDRLVGSAKLENILVNDEAMELEKHQEVDLVIWDETDLGYKVIIEDEYLGLIYHNEIFEEVIYGERQKGYIKEIRADFKIDASIRRLGYAKVEPNADKILEEIQQNNGYLDLHDKSDPDDIYERLGMSKKTFKKSIGLLYKKDIIDIRDDGVYLVE